MTRSGATAVLAIASVASIARRRHRAAAWLHHSAWRPAGLRQYEGLRGIRRAEPSARLEHVAHGVARASSAKSGAAIADAPDVHEVAGRRTGLRFNVSLLKRENPLPVVLHTYHGPVLFLCLVV